MKQIEEVREAEERLAELLRKPEAVEFLARLLAEETKKEARVSGTGRERSRNSAVPEAESNKGFPNAPVDGQAAERPQRVVGLSEVERLIGSGYEFVAPLGPDKVVLRHAE